MERARGAGVAAVLVAAAVVGLLGVMATPASAATGPVFANGQAQIVPEFQDPGGWIRHDLWVETRFDSDGTGGATGCTWT